MIENLEKFCKIFLTNQDVDKDRRDPCWLQHPAKAERLNPHNKAQLW